MASPIDNIQTGDRITVKVTHAPTNEAARKTLRRILLKDPQHKADKRRQQITKQRNIRHHQRGGRRWAVRAPKQPVVHALPGETGTVLASQDVVQSLPSIARFVDLAKA